MVPHILLLILARPSAAQFPCLWYTLPPGSTHRQPQRACPMSNSIVVVNIGHAHGPAVSAFAESPCRPAALPHLMLLLLPCPQSVSLYFITSTTYSSVCSSLIEHSSDTSEGTRVTYSVWRFLFIVAYMCTKSLFCCTVLLLFFFCVNSDA